MKPSNTNIEKYDVATKNSNGRIILHAEGLQKSFGGQKVLDNVSIQLCRGEIVLLRGDNGSGKTTLLNILTGNIEPDAGAISLLLGGYEKKFLFPKTWWQKLNPKNHFTPERVALEGVGRTWQDIRLFLNMNLADNIAVGTPHQVGENPISALFRRSIINRQEQKIDVECKDVLQRLHLSGREKSSANKVSLGQAKRVAIIRAVQAGARILFLDEPLSGLDTDGVSEIISMLKELVREKNVTLIIVEHSFNIWRIQGIADTIWTLREGSISTDEPSLISKEMTHEDTCDIQSWIKDIAGLDGRVTHQDILGGANLSIIDFDSSPVNLPILEILDLEVFRGKRQVFGSYGTSISEHLSFTLCQGQIGILQAPNGWGKTTLLEAIAGLIKINKGCIKLHSQSLQNTKSWQRRDLGISFLQSRNILFPSLSVHDSLRLAGIDSKGADGVCSLYQKRIADLSGGERQRVAIAILKGNPVSMLLLDEPLSMLDSTGIDIVSDLVRSVANEGAVLLAVPSEIKE